MLNLNQKSIKVCSKAITEYKRLGLNFPNKRPVPYKDSKEVVWYPPHHKTKATHIIQESTRDILSTSTRPTVQDSIAASRMPPDIREWLNSSGTRENNTERQKHFPVSKTKRVHPKKIQEHSAITKTLPDRRKRPLPRDLQQSFQNVHNLVTPMTNPTGTFCWLNSFMQIIIKLVNGLQLSGQSNMEKIIVAASKKRGVINNRRLTKTFKNDFNINNQQDCGEFILETFGETCPSFTRLFNYTISKSFRCAFPTCDTELHRTVHQENVVFPEINHDDLGNRQCLPFQTIIQKLNITLNGLLPDPGTGCAAHPTYHRTVQSHIIGHRPRCLMAQLNLPPNVNVKLPTEIFEIAGSNYYVDSIIHWHGHISERGIRGHFISYLNFTNDHGIWISASDMDIQPCIDENTLYVHPYIIVFKIAH